MLGRHLYSILIAGCVVLTCLFTGAYISKQADSRPNVVLFFIDDLGYGDLSSYGAMSYRTPHLDQMAVEGTRFTNFLAAQAVCSASRAAILTGCYPNRVGMSGALGPNSRIGLNLQEETLAELLKARGYATGIFGKWHLGDDSTFLPLQHGFDEYFGVPYSHDMWPLHPNQAQANYPPLFWIEGSQRTKEIKTLEDAGEITSAITERALSFIRKHKKKPFFLYLPYPMPHVPLAASTPFRGKSKQGLFADVLTELDWSVGQVLQELKKQGLDKNTLVIFTSDNGPWLNYGDHAGSSGGFREGKGTSFEGGHRVPCIIRWPGVVTAGRVCNKLLTTMDILPTVVKLCGAGLPKNKIDGIEWVDLLKGNEQVNPRENFLYYYRRNSLEAVRKGDWKLVFAHPGRTYEGLLPGKDGQPGPLTENFSFPTALYNLRRDPGERYDVREQNPGIVAELEKLAEEARQDLGDDLQNRPGNNRRQAGVIDENR
ncbi:sulfatase [Rhodocytophaga rosea]|uniref:Sulfatase n=1 Tax=Rhodocytophaga rosea TaxID=2704465 RepID=A0A6C0GCN8_9BACT|nr:sulfatase [Rhodocytophaga rosea]QHT65725.1 sulfatase [Rhodocytophaga rosea]